MARLFRLQPDTLFAGAYRVRRLLGQGAMGAVYLVEEEGTRTPRALKLMSPDLSADPKFVERFAQESRISSAIQSEYIVPVLASGIDATSRLPFLVMEYLEGQDLGRWRDAHPDLPRDEAAYVLAQLFEAIGAAHDASVVHRDLKPENVFVTRRWGQPFVRVLDFGVAKVVRDNSASGTEAGLGAPLWAAPEQSEQGAIRPSTDVWALGLLTFRVLTGRIFWKSADPHSSIYDLALELVHGPIPPASVRAAELGCARLLPAGFDAWFSRCVVRDRQLRFQTARIAGAALAPLLLALETAP